MAKINAMYAETIVSESETESDSDSDGSKYEVEHIMYMDEENAAIVYKDVDVDGEFTTGYVNIKKDLNCKQLVRRHKQQRGVLMQHDITNESIEDAEDAALVLEDDDVPYSSITALTPAQVSQCTALVPVFPFPVSSLKGVSYSSTLARAFMFNTPRSDVINVSNFLNYNSILILFRRTLEYSVTYYSMVSVMRLRAPCTSSCLQRLTGIMDQSLMQPSLVR